MYAKSFASSITPLRLVKHILNRTNIQQGGLPSKLRSPTTSDFGAIPVEKLVPQTGQSFERGPQRADTIDQLAKDKR